MIIAKNERTVKKMAKQLTLGLTYEQASAEVEQIKRYYEKIDELGKKAESAMLAICPLLANLNATNGWLHLDNYSSVDNSHDHKSFGKWAEDFFNKAHSTMAETIAVSRRYFGDNGELKNPDHSQFGYTQLLRMRKLTDEEIAENITPEMSSADIKKLVVELKTPQKKIETSESEVPTMAIPENLKSLMTDVDVPEDVSRETSEEINKVSFTLSELPDDVQGFIVQLFEGIDIVTIDMRA